MFVSPPARLALYDARLDTPEPDEAAVGQEINRTMARIREITFADEGHALRSVHAKSHGLLEAEMTIDPDLPRELAQGLFAQPGRYPVVMRFSTTPGDLLDDSVSTPRAVALKVLGVSGDRLPGPERATQDFVLIDGKTFPAPNAKVFLANLKLLAPTTDKAEGFKKVLSAGLRGLEHLVEAAGGESGLLKNLGGQPETHILGDHFYSQLPIRFGDHIAKIGLAPVSPNLVALKDAPLHLNGRPDGLREAVNAFFASETAEWDLRVQFCTDLKHMPIDPANQPWDEDDSPYFPVARIRAAPQVGWSAARSEAVDDGMAFSPWHGLEAHRPLGSLMRLRREAYEQSRQFRAEHNRRPVAEPTSAVLP